MTAPTSTGPAAPQGEGGASGPVKQQLALPDDAANWRNLIKDCDRKIAEFEELKKLARTHLEQMLGDAEEGLIDGQVAVRWTYVRSNRFDTTKFKAARPDLYSEFQVEGVSRRFTLPDPA